jgi:uncharacterized membrane protein YciS (DUF1049 family)
MLPAMNLDVVELLIIIALGKANLSLIVFHFYHNMTESGEFKISSNFLVLGMVTRKRGRVVFWFVSSGAGHFYIRHETQSLLQPDMSRYLLKC